MSMNLAFEIDGLQLDFPFQTPTVLSYAVLNARGTKAKLALIKTELEKWGWTPRQITEMLEKCEKLFNNRKFNLVVV